MRIAPIAPLLVPLAATVTIAFTALVASALPENSSVPGGVAVLRIAATTEPAPTARFRGRPVLIARQGDGWFALVGLPLDLKPGRHSVDVSQGSSSKVSAEFTVAKKTYPVQHITLADKRKVEPSPEDLLRIAREQAEIDQAKNHWDELADVDLALQIPAEGRLSSRFGLRRIFNGQPRSPHAGLDIAVPTGTVVAAAAAGDVIDTGDYFFNGNTIFVDHGQGLITMYCHLSEISVRVGDRLQRGQQLGLSGMSGRATGPHLHWSVILNGALVDPEVFVGTAAGAR